MNNQLGLWEKQPAEGDGPRLYTSCFKRNGKNPKAVAISQGVPKGWSGSRYMKLAPPWPLVHEKDPVKYAEAYRSQLSKLDVDVVVAELGDGSVLLCWEVTDSNCHRRLVAEWIRESGVSVVEI